MSMATHMKESGRITRGMAREPTHTPPPAQNMSAGGKSERGKDTENSFMQTTNTSECSKKIRYLKDHLNYQIVIKLNMILKNLLWMKTKNMFRKSENQIKFDSCEICKTVWRDILRGREVHACIYLCQKYFDLKVGECKYMLAVPCKSLKLRWLIIKVYGHFVWFAFGVV